MSRVSSAAAAILIASCGAASAQTATVRPLLGFGLTGGGDTFANIQLSNGTTESVRAGQVLQVYGGFEYQGVPELSIQTTIGYHFDDTSASDATARFSRYPLELLGHFHVAPNFRLGGGLRYVLNPTFTLGGSLGTGTYDFKNTLGAVIEGEYLFGPSFGLKLRYVNEQYELKDFPGASKYDGSHVGLMFNWYL